MNIVVGVIAFIIILGVIILVHEGGHFFFAKRAGILCYEFSIGMGPVIWQTKKGETVYSIRAIPIGGYVSMAGEEIDVDPLRGKKEVKLVLENERVKKIILDLQNPEYRNLTTYTVLESDLIGTEHAYKNELFLEVKDEDNREFHFFVDRDVLINYNKKQTFQNAPYERNFNNKSIGKRFWALFAGPMMNFFLALLLFLIIGLFTGYANYNSTVIENVEAGTPVALVGMQDGDKITAINGESVSVWDDISEIMDRLASGEGFTGTVQVTYLRNGETNTVTVNPNVYINSIELFLEPNGSNQPVVGEFPGDVNEQSRSYKEGFRPGDIITKINDTEIATRGELLAFFETNPEGTEGGNYQIEVDRSGEVKTINIEGFSKRVMESQEYTMNKVQLGISPEYQFNLGKSLYMPFVQTGDAALIIFRTLGLLFADKTVGVGDLAGPIGILTATTTIAKSGIISLLNWTAILSVNIGLLNILPLPALDGGRLAFIAYEGVTKKRPNARVENTIHMIGFILLMTLFVFVAFSDVLRCAGLK